MKKRLILIKLKTETLPPKYMEVGENAFAGAFQYWKVKYEVSVETEQALIQFAEAPHPNDVINRIRDYDRPLRKPNVARQYLLSPAVFNIFWNEPSKKHLTKLDGLRLPMGVLLTHIGEPLYRGYGEIQYINTGDIENPEGF